jgi:hypothetical protein
MTWHAQPPIPTTNAFRAKTSRVLRSTDGPAGLGHSHYPIPWGRPDL